MPKHDGNNKHVEKVIPKTIEKVLPRSGGGAKKNVDNAENGSSKKEEKEQEPVRRQSSRKNSTELSNKENSAKEPTEAKSKTAAEKKKASSKDFVTTRRYRPPGDEVDYRESQEDILLRQITNPAIVDKPRQRAPPKQLGRSPKPSEILRDYAPTTFAMSPSPGNEASVDDLSSHKKAMGKRKSRVDAMIAAEKRRLNAVGLTRIGEHTRSTLPPVTSGYASLVSPARNFSSLISPSPAHKLKPTPKSRPGLASSSRLLSVPERGNLNNLSPLSMRTARSLDATPAADTSLFSLLSTPAPSSKKQSHSSSFSSPVREVASTPRTLSKLAMKDILAAASPSMPPPPPRRLTRASAKQEAPAPAPPPKNTPSVQVCANELEHKEKRGKHAITKMDSITPLRSVVVGNALFCSPSNLNPQVVEEI